LIFFFSSRRRHTRFSRDWSSDVCSSDLERAWLLSKRREQGYGGRCTLGGTQRSGAQRAGVGRRGATIAWSAGAFLGSLAAQTLRSEERRVGKGRRSRGTSTHQRHVGSGT